MDDLSSAVAWPLCVQACQQHTAMQLRAATRCDPILSRVLQYAKHGWPHQVSDVFKPYHTRQNELALENGCVMWGVRVIVPKMLQEQVLHELHRSHPGIAGQCQSVRSSPSVAPLHPWSWPSRPWQRIHVDYAGPFRGRNFLIVVDAHSKWPEVIQINLTTSSATIHELRRLFATYGLPEQLVSDNGLQFVSDEFKVFLKANHVKQHHIILPLMVLQNVSFVPSSKLSELETIQNSPSISSL